jgi:hypothetical protein
MSSFLLCIEGHHRLNLLVRAVRRDHERHILAVELIEVVKPAQARPARC